ncbi:MAG: MBL fold metallo-hydrolase [Bacteroidales bacterium]|nr:MBL fold metallo-hydrolase [Bacteroidales bacterium]
MIHIEHFTFNSFQTRCSVVWDDSGVCAFVDPGCASAAELSRLTAFTASRGLRPAAIMLTHAHFDHIYGVDALVREYGIPVYMHPDEVYTLRNTNPYVCRMYGLPEPETAFADGLLSGSAVEAASEMGCGPISEPGCGPAPELGCGPGDETASGPACGSVSEKACGPTSEAGCGPGDETASGPACGPVNEKACGPDSGLVTVVEGDVIKVGTLRFEVIETPGHTAGGICLFEREDGVLFTGDTLFAGAIGRTDHPGGDYDQLMKSILQKLLPLDSPAAPGSDTSGSAASGPVASGSFASGSFASGSPAAPATPAGVTSAGATSAPAPRNITVVPGHGPCSDLATEGMTNPFLMPFNEPYED